MAKIDSCVIRDTVISTVKTSDMFIRLLESNPKIKIYDNAVSQGCMDGCFFVKSSIVPRKHQLGNIYQHSEKVEIRYFVPNEESEDIALIMINELTDLMEYIQIDGQYFRGKDMECNITDRILHFYVTYQTRVIQEEVTEETMQILEDKFYLK